MVQQLLMSLPIDPFLDFHSSTLELRAQHHKTHSPGTQAHDFSLQPARQMQDLEV